MWETDVGTIIGAKSVRHLRFRCWILAMLIELLQFHKVSAQLFIFFAVLGTLGPVLNMDFSQG